jgi:hypothetical protein
MPSTADLLAELDTARQERDDALRRLAEARAELDALRLALKTKDEPEPPLYPVTADIGTEAPLRYVAADAINDTVKRLMEPVQKAIRSKLGTRHGR